MCVTHKKHCLAHCDAWGEILEFNQKDDIKNFISITNNAQLVGIDD